MNWILILIILSLNALPGREINRTFLIEDEYDKYTSVGEFRTYDYKLWYFREWME